MRTERRYASRSKQAPAKGGRYFHEDVNLRNIVFLCSITLLLILSDCAELAGPWMFNLKYPGLVLLISISLLSSFHCKINSTRIVLAAFAVAVLFFETLFQESAGQTVQALALFLGVGIIACFSGSLIKTRREMLWLGVFTTLAIAVLLYISRESCMRQWQFYTSIGRPRLKGCFTNANSFGAISSIALILCSVGSPKSRAEGSLRSLCLLVSAAMVLVSGSRTSILMVAGFFLALAYQRIEGRMKSKQLRLLLLFAVIIASVVAAHIAAKALENDIPVILRLRTLRNISLTDPHAWFGYGYLGSSNIKVLNAIAGGALEMLIVSLFYRMGIVGICAYAILVFSTSLGNSGSDRTLSRAFLVAVLLQSIGESFLSSIMSYPSCFNWILLSALPMIEVVKSDKEGASATARNTR